VHLSVNTVHLSKKSARRSAVNKQICPKNQKYYCAKKATRYSCATDKN
jgi:hypothetical protein